MVYKTQILTNHHRVMLGTSIIRQANLSKSFFGHLIVPPQPPSDDPAVSEIILQPSIERAIENVIQQADDRALELERLLAQPPPPDDDRVTENTGIISEKSCKDERYVSIKLSAEMAT